MLSRFAAVRTNYYRRNLSFGSSQQNRIGFRSYYCNCHHDHAITYRFAKASRTHTSYYYEKACFSSKAVSNPKNNKETPKQERPYQRHYRLNKRIQQCRTLQDLIDLQQLHQTEMSPIHVCSCWTKAASLIRNKVERDDLNEIPSALLPLMTNTRSKLEKFNGRDLATVASNLSKLSTQTQMTVDPKLWKALEERTIQQATSLQSREMSSLLWSFAKAGRLAPNLFAALQEPVIQHLDTFTDQGMANIVWAYARTQQYSPHLLDAIARQASKQINKFSPQSLSNMTWAFAKLKHSSPILFEAITSAAIQSIPEFRPQELSILAWSCAKLGYQSPELFQAISREARTNLQGFQIQELSNLVWAFAKTRIDDEEELLDAVAVELIKNPLDQRTWNHIPIIAWSYAKLGHKTTPLFALIAQRATPKVLHRFQAQNLCNLVWAFAKIDHRASELFDQTATVATEKLDTFSSQGISNLVWAYATADHASPALFDAVADKLVADTKLHTYPSQAISTILWSYARIGHAAPDLFEKVSKELLTTVQLQHYSTQSLANIAWAYATAGHPATPFLLDAMVVNLSRCQPQEVSTIVWTYATVCHVPPPELLNAAAETASQRISNFSTPSLSKLAWSFATLNYDGELFWETAAKEAMRRGLDDFTPQELSNLVWSYATMMHKDVDFLNQVSKRVVESNLKDYSAQSISIILWSYGKLNHPAPTLLNAVANHLPRAKLDTFTSQGITNLLWSFAKQSHFPANERFLEDVSDIAIQRVAQFDSHGVANTVWAMAKLGYVYPELTNAMVKRATPNLESFKAEEITLILWSLAVLNISTTDAAMPFFSEISQRYHRKKEGSFLPTFWNDPSNAKDHLTKEDLSKIHQASIWFTVELGNASLLPDVLEQECRDAFCSRNKSSSLLQSDVVASLRASSYHVVQEEVLCQTTAYTLDAVVRGKDVEFAIEVDGPSHFLSNGKPTGSTLLKRRQLSSNKRRPLLSVPYWEWNELDPAQKQDYIQELLG